MKRGKIINLSAGIFDIIFGVGMIAFIVLFFLTGMEILGAEVGEFLVQPFMSLFVLVVKLGIDLTVDSIKLIPYIFLALIAVFGILSLVFGSLSVSRTRKDQKKYYRKGGRLIAYAVVETIVLAIFIVLLAYHYSAMSVIFVSVLGLVVLLRYIGIGLFYAGKKKFVAETPVA